MAVSGPASTAVAAVGGSSASTTPSEIAATWRRGTLRRPAEAPGAGERFEEVLRHRNLVVEQILSGRVDEPRRYTQDQDEWVVVLAGAASVEVEGQRADLGAGDWLFLPSGVPHTVVRTDEGTSWLAVHLHF